MPDLKTALIILGSILGFCLFLVLGGYLGKKTEVFRVVIFAGILALIAIIIFVIYVVWFTLTKHA